MKKSLLIAALLMSSAVPALADNHAVPVKEMAEEAVEELNAVMDEAAEAVQEIAEEAVVEQVVESETPVVVEEKSETVSEAVVQEIAQDVVVPENAQEVAEEVAESNVEEEVEVVETPQQSEHKAPYEWSNYEICKNGSQQSPVNINQFIKGDLQPLSVSYAPSPLEVANTGKTVQVNYVPGSGFRAHDKNFVLKHFEFRTPSEHYIDGAPYPMEAHFVHQASDGTLGMIAVMMKVGAHNPVIEGIWQNVPQSGNTKTVESVSLNAADLMPADKGYYAYDGSLTAPPCTEGVKWHVMKEPIEISQKQLTAFQAVFPVNARPIQELGQRSVRGN